MDLNYYGQKLEFDIDLKGNFTNIKYNGNNLLDNLVLNPESEIKGGSKILTWKIKYKNRVNIFLYAKKIKSKFNDSKNDQNLIIF